MNPQVLAMVRKSALGAALGNDGMQFNLETAVAKYQATTFETGSANTPSC
jgi:hypothetical protein